MQKPFLLLLLLVVTTVAIAQTNFEVKPAKPTPGSVLTIEFLTRNTALQGQKDIEGVAYLLEGRLPLAKPITLKKNGGVYTGTVKTNDTTRAVFFSFSKDEIRENNNDGGYFTPLYDKKGHEVPGANQAIGQVFYSYGGIWGLKRDAEKAAVYNKKEFANPPARERFRNDYLAWLVQSPDAADREELKKELEVQAKREGLKEEDLDRVVNLYERTLKDKAKADAVRARIREQFPNGDWKRTEAMMAFNKETNLAAREKLFKDFTEQLGPFTKDNQYMADNLASQLARQAADSGDYGGMKKYAAMVHSTTAVAGIYNNVAWKLAGEGIGKKPGDVALGKELSERSLALVQQEMKEQKGRIPYLTPKQYNDNLQSTFHGYADTYATLLYHAGDYDKAYAIEKKAVDHFKGKNIGLNEAFAVMTEKVKGAKAAQDLLETYLQEGHYNPAMKARLKTLYLASNHSEEQWINYTSEIEQRELTRMKAELAKKMINLPAPLFALKDLEGREVSLASLKGKVVVVDFWATWCGPCIASFPGMQKAIEKLKNNPDVVFLFVNTWERGDDREKKVTGFMAENKYPFHVLYDATRPKDPDAFTVVEEYGVEGIPTKFIIDRNGAIRFKSVGYMGNADELANEVLAMIDMAASESGKPLAKGF